jgi:NADH:ubiquinone oxidoreductase subunit 4 (subunit M)
MGEPRPPVVERVYDLTTSERGIVLALAGLIFWIGLGPGPFIQAMRPSLTALEQVVEAGSQGSVTVIHREVGGG